MIRWITLLSGTVVASGFAGLGFVGRVDGTARGWWLALTALSATLLISSFDAYETERQPVRERDDDQT